ncbi:MAG: hypothetical protein ACOCXT_06600 [Candidatus Dojkabacteria bacterium]
MTDATKQQNDQEKDGYYNDEMDLGEDELDLSFLDEEEDEETEKKKK